MMRYLWTFALWASMVTYTLSLQAQTHEEKLEERLEAPKVLIVLNIHGSIDLVGERSSNILLEVDKALEGHTQNGLERAKEEVRLGKIWAGDTLVLYVESPFQRLEKNNGRWQYNWIDQRSSPKYEFVMDFYLNVPAQTHIYLSTINKGDISIKNVMADMHLRNINGSIRMDNVSGRTDVHTINGDVDIFYTQNPNKDSKYYTLNGDMNIFFQDGLSADFTFESFNGELFSHFDYDFLPHKITRTVSSKKAKTKYEIESLTRIRVRNGGPLLELETFNGNVYLKKSEG